MGLKDFFTSNGQDTFFTSNGITSEQEKALKSVGVNLNTLTENNLTKEGSVDTIDSNFERIIVQTDGKITRP